MSLNGEHAGKPHIEDINVSTNPYSNPRQDLFTCGRSTVLDYTQNKGIGFAGVQPHAPTIATLLNLNQTLFRETAA